MVKVIAMAVKDLVPYANNPRNNEQAVDTVAKSIKEFGFTNPIVVDSDNVVINGHTRLLAAEKLGLEKVPVIRKEDLTPEQVKAFRLVDNKTSELSGWDFEKLDAEIAELQAMDFDMSEFEFESSHNFNAEAYSDFFEDASSQSQAQEQSQDNSAQTEHGLEQSQEPGKSTEPVSKAVEQEIDDTDSREVVCPHCGKSFVL